MADLPAAPPLRRGGGHLAAVAVLALVIALMAPAASFEFLHWDDDRIVAALNQRQDWLLWLPRLDVTYLFTPVSLALLRGIAEGFGLAPRPFHLTALALHVFNMAAVYLLVLRLQERWLPAGCSARAGAVGAAMLWGVNPLRVEVLAWTAALPYALATALALLALHAYLPRRGDPVADRGHGAGFGVFYALAVLAHPVAVPLAALPVLIDWIGDRDLRQRRVAYLAYLTIGAAAMAGQAYVRAVLGVGGLTRPGLQSVATEIAKVLGFLGDFGVVHAWWPTKVSLVYATYGASSWSNPAFWFGALLPLAAGFAGLIARGAARKWLLAWLVCHLAFALPAAGTGVANYLLADRYLYLLTVFAAVGVGLAANGAIGKLAAPRRGAGIVAVASSVAIAAGIYAVQFSSLLPAWRNTESLLDRLAQTAPDRSWELWAKVRKLDYLAGRAAPEPVLRAALLGLARVRAGPQDDWVSAVEYLARRGRCNDAERLLSLAGDPVRAREAAHRPVYLRACRHGSR